MRYLYLTGALFAIWSCGSGGRQPAAVVVAADTAYHNAMVAPLTDSIGQFPDKADLYFRRALLLFNTNPTLAQRDFEKAASLDSKQVDYWAGAGEAALLSEDYSGAARFFRQALLLQPDYSYLQYKLAMALTEAKQYTAADSLATLLSRQAATRDQAFYLKARMAEDLKDTVAAIAHLRSAVAAAGTHSEYEAVMELGDLLQAKGSPDAVAYYTLAFRLDSTNAEPLHAIGRYYDGAGKKAQAVAAYKQCIAADPAYAPVYMSLGKLYKDQQQWKEALYYFNLGAKTAPTDAACYYYRGLCYERTGNKEAAIADYNKALSFRKQYPEASQALAALEGGK
ncbi:tetratricopeptide repeat protein [Chitinophaga pendula]|uniref:tetratricopeptide repeat protein n=1 Tax=Chitinophaga TaxID=79328 RepID=UPI0012FE1B11|nr:MULTISPECIES: tetratricopeptide repeat protein [Chitinophaga]UCJ08767.1 tetratricopeptide repeat protein [Chitinophaga pendula]